jgi:predicted nucleic acid-binding protein
VLAILQFQTHVTVRPWLPPSPPDEDDVVFLEVALKTPARTVVTGNLAHFPIGCRGSVTVLSPRAACERFVGLGQA